MTVKVIKLITGDIIYGSERLTTDNTKTILERNLELIKFHDKEGNLQFVLLPYEEHSDAFNSVEVNNTNIVYSTEPNPEMLKYYNEVSNKIFGKQISQNEKKLIV